MQQYKTLILPWIMISENREEKKTIQNQIEDAANEHLILVARAQI